MTKKTHYTAHIDIKRVDREVSIHKVYNQETRTNEDQRSYGDREVTQVANLSFTAADPEILSEKVAKHMELIEDGERDGEGPSGRE